MKCERFQNLHSRSTCSENNICALWGYTRTYIFLYFFFFFARLEWNQTGLINIRLTENWPNTLCSLLFKHTLTDDWSKPFNISFRWHKNLYIQIVLQTRLIQFVQLSIIRKMWIRYYGSVPLIFNNVYFDKTVIYMLYFIIIISVLIKCIIILYIIY